MAAMSPVMRWAFLTLMEDFKSPFMCLDNCKKEDSPDQISSKIVKASSTALEVRA